ncbi:TPR end-of-group domain-containing protein, partial [Rhodohalobacter sulfatireducens]
EPEDIQFTDGVHEELINRLAGIGDLTVIARSSVLSFEPRNRDLQNIAQQLGVSSLMEGTVRRLGDQLRVSVQLIDVNSLGTLWSGSFEENIDDVFEIQSRIARQVAGELQASLTADEEHRLDERPTDNPEAYRLYMLGQQYISQGTQNEDNLVKAEELLSRAVDEEPTFAEAWAMLARTYFSLYWFHGRTPEQLEGLKEAAERAELLNPNLPETKYAVGLYLYWSQTDHRQTLDYFESALEQFPNHKSLHNMTAYTHRRLGNWELMVHHFKRALELDPITGPYGELGYDYLMLRDYEKAESYIDKALDSNPNSFLPNFIKALIGLSKNGSLENYELWWTKIQPSDPGIEQPYFWGEYNVLKRNWDEALRGFKNIQGETAARSETIYLHKAYLIGMALEGQGNQTEARLYYNQAKVHFEELRDQYPDDALYHSELGKVYARLGEVEKAIQAGKKATELTPASQNANTGPFFEFNLAEIYAWTAREELAIDKLEFCLSVPHIYVHRNWIRLDPRWDPLRDNPRFQQLIAGEDKPYLEGL